MRYIESNKITFTNSVGETTELIEAQELQLVQTFLKEIDIQTGDMLDEIAQRKDVFDSENEQLWYFIFDFNAADIIDNGFSLTGINKLKIPTSL